MKIFYALVLSNMFALITFSQQTFDCERPTQFKFLDVNNVKAYISNTNILWTGGGWLTVYEVPKVDPPSTETPKNVLNSGNIWIGGLADDGQLKVAASTYGQSGEDFWTGPIENEATNMQTCNKWNEIFEITLDEVSDLYYNGVVTENLLKYPAKNNPHLINEIGIALPVNEDYFPFYDVNADGIYNPNDGDYPNITGDQSLYWIMNDIGNEHTETNGQALGVEIKCSAYAYDQFGLDLTTFYRYEISNKSTENINDFIFGFRADPDLGYFNDDFVGVDSINNIAYVYNGDDFDEGASGYDSIIPIVGIVLLEVPFEVASNQSKLGAFVFHNNDFTLQGNPESPQNYYSYLNGNWKNDQSITYGEDGFNPNNPATNFMFPSAPNDSSANAWSECSNENTPADRRFLMAAKPINLAVGQTVTYELAVVSTFDVSYPCPDIKGLQESVEYVQAYYDNYIKAQLLTTAIEKENVVTNKVNIYPNPIKDHIKVESDTQFTKATIYDLNGKQVVSNLKVFNNLIALSSKQLTKGNYVLKLITTEGKIAVKKIIME